MRNPNPNLHKPVRRGALQPSHQRARAQGQLVRVRLRVMGRGRGRVRARARVRGRGRARARARGLGPNTNPNYLRLCEDVLQPTGRGDEAVGVLGRR